MTNFVNWLETIFNGLSGFTILFVVAIVTLLIIYRAIKKVPTTSQTKRPPVVPKVDRSHAPLDNPFIHGNPVAPEQPTLF